MLGDIIKEYSSQLTKLTKVGSDVEIIQLFRDIVSKVYGLCLSVGVYLAPFLFIGILIMIWSLARVGSVRKTLSTILFCCLFPPLYSVLLVAGLYAVCAVVAAIITGVAVVIPIVLVGWFYFTIIFAVIPDFIGVQLRLARDPANVREDINCGELLVALITFMVSLPTAGLLVGTLTILKAPFVILAVTTKTTYRVFEAFINHLSDCGCCFITMLLLFPFGFCGGVAIEVLLVIISIIAKILLAALWPAYVASGWIRSFHSRRRNPALFNPLKAMKHACIATYQIIWFSDAITNLGMYGPDVFRGDRPDIVSIARFKRELSELVVGTRIELSADIKRLSMFPPPVMIGILFDRNNWIQDLNENFGRREVEHLARSMNTEPTVLGKIWNSMFEHMHRIGQKNIENQLLNKDYLLELPPAAVTGLPQVVLLKCVERTVTYECGNSENKLVLDLSKANQNDSNDVSEVTLLRNSNSDIDIFILSNDNRPKGIQFVEDVWGKMMEIKKLYHEYNMIALSDESNCIENGEFEKEKALFEAIVLSAGESFDNLPNEFQSFFERHGVSENMDFEREFFHQSERRKKLHSVRNLLNDIGLKVAKEQKFKSLMMTKVINPLTSDN